MVLDQGQIMEFDTPRALLDNRQSLFYQLALSTGATAAT
jgi:ABC-type multidrug transport system fused ATPase/permease subunit